MKDTLFFIRQMARRFRTTGAIAPSGRPLARELAAAVGEVADDQVLLELGPGTGEITTEIVARFPRNQLVAVEINDEFADRVAKNFPSVTLVRGCASQLEQHLKTLNIEPERVAGIISGLPLLALPGDLPQQILASIAAVLKPGRRYIQFTYSERAWRRFATPGLKQTARKRVWMNVPPAVVLTFERTAP
jgi:phosphatidylethanolamine/phosphatidyl-N-methylethanolamine N-methyltransferase